MDIQYNRISLDDAIKRLGIMYDKCKKFEKYKVRKDKEVFKEDALKNVKIIYDGMSDIIDGFDRVFLIKSQR